MSMTIDANPEHISKIVQAGIAAEFKKLIEKQLIEAAKPTIEALAERLAEGVAVNVQMMIAPPSASNPFGNEVRVQVNFDGVEKVVKHVNERGVMS